MPTISQLPLANGVSSSDELPLSQSGTTRSTRVDVLLAGTQPMIVAPTGSLLGRVSLGAGQPETIAPGAGLALEGQALAANGTDHLVFRQSNGLQSGDEVVVNSQGQPMRMQATLLRALFSPGLGVTIGADGTISAPGTVGPAGPAGPQGVPGPVGSVSNATGVVLSDVSAAPSPPSSGLVLYSQSGQLRAMGPTGLSSVGGGAGPLPSSAALIGTTAGGAAQAVTLGNGLTLTGATLSAVATSYTLPPASSTTLGGVKQGANVSIGQDGTISVAASFNAALLAAVATSGSYSDLTNKPTIPAPYSLPVATVAALGGVKQGANVTIAGDGTISVPAPFSASYADLTGKPAIPAALPTNAALIGSGAGGAPQAVTLGTSFTLLSGTLGLKLGTGLTVAGDGTISATGGGGSSITLPSGAPLVGTTAGGAAQAITLGSGLTLSGTTLSASATYTLTSAGIATALGYVPVNQSGLAAVATSGSYNDLANKPAIPAAYTLPAATALALGGVKAGSGLAVAGDGTLSATATSYTLPTATATTLGGIKVGVGLAAAGDGTLSATYSYTLPTASATTLGGVKVDGTTITVSGGVISAAAAPAAKYAATITGDGTTTSFTVTHGLGTQDVIVQTLDPANNFATISTLEPTRPTANTVVVPFSAAPTAGTTFRVVVRS